MRRRRTWQHVNALEGAARARQVRRVACSEPHVVKEHVVPPGIWEHSDVRQRDGVVADVCEDDLARKELRGVVQPGLQPDGMQLRLHIQRDLPLAKSNS